MFLLLDESRVPFLELFEDNFDFGEDKVCLSSLVIIVNVDLCSSCRGSTQDNGLLTYV